MAQPRNLIVVKPVEGEQLTVQGLAGTEAFGKLLKPESDGVARSERFHCPPINSATGSVGCQRIAVGQDETHVVASPEADPQQPTM